MRNFIQQGDRVTITAPSGGTTSGVGVLTGAHMFGVALTTNAQGESAEILIEGVVEIAKTSALAISIGDLLYWDNTNKVVNKTSTSQKPVGYAVGGAVNPSATVLMRLVPNLTVPA